jgi:hypothetical protein
MRPERSPIQPNLAFQRTCNVPLAFTWRVSLFFKSSRLRSSRHSTFTHRHATNEQLLFLEAIQDLDPRTQSPVASGAMTSDLLYLMFNENYAIGSRVRNPWHKKVVR